MGNDAEILDVTKRDGINEYEPVGSAKTFNGVKGRIIKRVGDSENHSNLPRYSKTSEIYFRKNANGVCQARVYLDNKMTLDIDWSHNHRNKNDGRSFKAGTVHVQMWKWHSDGSFTRLSNDARFMNNAEMKKYGPIIKAFCPNVKFR